MDKKVVLITGCSSGFGREMVSSFLQEGWAVVATLRRAGERQGLFSDEKPRDPSDLTILDLDVTSQEQRTQACDEIQRHHGRLDCLVNNAGYGLFGALEDLSEDQLRHQFEANFWGAALMTRQFLPLLRKSGGRVINVSSMVGFCAIPLTSAYSASKFALEGLTEALYYELKPHGVQVALVEPGGFRTRFGDNVRWSETSATGGTAYATQTAGMMRFRERLASREGASPKAVATAVLKLIGAARMPLRTRCGQDATGSYLLKKLAPANLSTWLFSSLYDRVLMRAGA